MKEKIYDGINTKCLIINLMAMEINPYSNDQMDKNFKNFLKNTFSIDQRLLQYCNYILNDYKIIRITSESAEYDGHEVFINTGIVVVKLPDRRASDVANHFIFGSRDWYMESNEEWEAPKALVVKMICSSGYYVTKLFANRSYYGERNQFSYWFERYNTGIERLTQPVISFETDVIGRNKYIENPSYTEQLINSMPQFNIKVYINENIIDSINNQDEFWYASSYINSVSKDLSYARRKGKVKNYAFRIKNTLVITDNIKGYHSIKDKLIENDTLLSMINLIEINQYSIGCRNGGELVCETMGEHNNVRQPSYFNTLVLNLVNRKKVKDIIIDRFSPNRIAANIKYSPKGDKILKTLSIFFDKRYNTNKSFLVIPYELNSTIHLDAMDFIKEYRNVDYTNEESFVNEKYFRLFYSNNNTERDVLTEWFAACAATAKTDEQRLKDAYNNLRENLVKEYKDIEKYLSANDLSKKKPVPSITLKDILTINPLKKISFNYKTNTITSINYRQLNEPLVIKTLDLKYCFPIKSKVKNNIKLITGKIELNKLYDPSTNNIAISGEELIKEHMRGVL